MGYPTKVQLIKRKSSEQWYINFPSAVAQAMDFERGETVEWFVKDRATLVLKRPSAPPLETGKAKKGGSLRRSAASSKSAGTPSGASAATSGRKP
jgi:hypothetical protein